MSGFLSFKDTKQPESEHAHSHFAIGQLLDVTVKKVSGNGRICDVTIDPKLFTSSLVSLY